MLAALIRVRNDEVSDTTGVEQWIKCWEQKILKPKLNKKLLYVYFSNQNDE